MSSNALDLHITPVDVDHAAVEQVACPEPSAAVAEKSKLPKFKPEIVAEAPPL
jgi:hypothetical protein